MSALSGVLLIDKPIGPTSHDIVAIVRRSLKIRRVGHTGTLDPFASGLLLVCVGMATRISEYLLGLPKAYAATAHLGTTTETDDREGAPLNVDGAWQTVSAEAVEAALGRQRGEIMQVPPRYSAKRVGGVRAHVLARQGAEVPAVPVAVTIDRIEMTRFEPPELDLAVVCSSGTYIRSIARDLGESLGVGAHLTALRRTAIGHFSVDEALTLDRLEQAAEALITPLAALAHLPRIAVSDAERALLSQGRRVPVGREGAREGASGPIAVHDGAGGLVAIGEVDDDLLQPRKVFT